MAIGVLTERGSARTHALVAARRDETVEAVCALLAAQGVSLTTLPTLTLAPESVGPLARAVARSRPAQRALARRLGAWLRAQNQFLVLDEATLAELERGIASAAGRLARAESTASEVARELAAFVSDRLGGAREVVAGQYSPAVQLEVLGLTVATLRGPVLDVGCGKNAHLVRHLRARGVDATGLDVDAPGDAERGDWLTFDYGAARWGTVLSHLGFSLHFWHQHHASAERARAYAETYLRIVRGLATGGVFAYAPSLPFFEPVLPRGALRITHHRFDGGDAMRSLAETSGIDLAESTRVERLR